MGGLCGLSTVVIALSLATVLSSTAVDAESESSPLNSGGVIDGLAADFDDDDREALMDEVKRAVFRSDLGKRDHEEEGEEEEDREIRDTRGRSRSRSFKTDLGKRRDRSMFRSDLGRRSAWPWQMANQAALARLRDIQRRRAMFRSDLGKRGASARRMFRTDLGKRQMFRHDLG